MKRGDLVRHKNHFWGATNVAINKQLYIVRWTEEKNNWVCVFGVEPPLQMSMMEIVSAAR